MKIRTKLENEIIESTREFATEHNILFDNAYESMISNALREQKDRLINYDGDFVQQLLDRWGFAKDGAIDVKNQLKIFSLLDWLRKEF